MGYTHYWRRPLILEAAKFKAWSSDLQKIYDSIENFITIKDAHGENEPEFLPDLVAFNGDDAAGLSHESFYVEQTLQLEPFDEPDSNGLYFQFCKTAQKPYDTFVVAALLLMFYYFHEVELSTDGDLSDWRIGARLVQTLFPDYGIKLETLEFLK